MSDSSRISFRRKQKQAEAGGRRRGDSRGRRRIDPDYNMGKQEEKENRNKQQQGFHHNHHLSRSPPLPSNTNPC
jgi:hypothetical protein